MIAFAIALSSCGGGDDDGTATGATPDSTEAAVSAASPLTVKRELAGAFTAGLEQLATMSQPRDEAAAIGQDIPTGTLTAVACKGQACTVRWRTVGGHRRRISYRVSTAGGGCVTGTAAPALGDVYDATTENAAVNPLNTLIGSRCS